MKQSAIKKHLIILSIIPFMLGNNVKAEEQNNIEGQSIEQIQQSQEQPINNENLQTIDQQGELSQTVVKRVQPALSIVDTTQSAPVGSQSDMQIMPSAQGVNEHNTVGLSKSMSLPVSNYKLNEMEQGLESVKRDQAEQRQRLQQLEFRIHEIDKSTKAVSNDIKENSKKDDLQEKAKDIFEQLNNEKVSKEDKLQLLKQYPGIVTIMGNNAYIYINEGKQFPLNIKDVIFKEVQANDIIKQLNDTNNSNIKETRKELLDKYPQIAQTLGLTTPEQINQYIEGTIQFPSDLNKAFANRAVTDYMVAKLNDSTVPVEEKTKLLASHPEISQTLGITKQEDLNKYFQEGNKLPDNFASTLSNKLMEKANTKKNKRSIVGVDGADIDRMFNQAAELPPTPPSIPVAPYVPVPVQTLTSPIVQTKTNVKPIDKSKINELKANNKTGTITDTEQYVVDNYLNNPNLTQEQKREILSNYPKIVERIGKENVENCLQNNIPFALPPAPPKAVPNAVPNLNTADGIIDYFSNPNIPLTTKKNVLKNYPEISNMFDAQTIENYLSNNTPFPAEVKEALSARLNTNATDNQISREDEIANIIKKMQTARTKTEQVNIVKDYPQLQKLVLNSIKNNKPININDIRQKLINDKGWNPALLNTEDLLKSSTKRAQLSLDTLEDAMLNAKTREQRSNILKLHPELKTLPGITSYLNTGRVPDLLPLQQRVVEQAHKKEPFGLEKLTEQDKSKQYKDDITLNKSNALHLDNDEAVNKWHTYNQLTKAELIKRLDNCEKTCKLLSSKIPVKSSNNLTKANIPTANNVQDTSDYTTWIKNAAGSLTKNEKFMNLINSKKDADVNNNGILTQQPDNNSQALVLYKQPLSEQFANQQVTNLVNKTGNISKEVEQNTIPVAPEVPVLNNTIKEEIKNISDAEMEQNQGVSNDQPALKIVDNNTVNSKQDAYEKLVYSMANSNDLKINNNVQLALTNAQNEDQPVLVDNSTTTVPTQLIGNNDAPVSSETKNISNTSNEEQGQVITKSAQQEIKSDVPETNNQNLEQKQTNNEQTQPVSETTLNTATTDDQDEDTIGNAMNKMFENAAKLPQTPPSAPIPPAAPAEVPILNNKDDVINYLNNPNIPAEKKQGILKSYPDLAKQFSLESNSLGNNDKVSGNINEIDAANNNQQGENIDNSSVNEAKQPAAAVQILSEIEESSEDVANINTDLSKSDKDKLEQINTVIEGFNSSKAE